jgi:pimeloyl-ACP methyl ester carboxylesterase
VTEEDLTPLLSSITVPTDIFWGEDDAMTPIADGRVMHAAIRGSALHTFPGVRHRVHRDRADTIASVIRSAPPSA